MSSIEVKHDALIKPIPCRVNLANVAGQEPSKTCKLCNFITPDRKKIKNGLIKTEFERVDVYPEFPELKASGKAGCSLCWLIRKTIRKNWAIRPMEEWGVGPIREKDGLWDELLDAPWDRKVKIHKVAFNVEAGTQNREDVRDGMIISLGLEFGPLTTFISQEPGSLYGENGQALSFKIFDSQDLSERNGELRRRLPSVSTLSKLNLELISKWINTCKSSHSTCRLLESPWRPTRLLDVGSLNSTELPRLVETAEENVNERYAAFSHMWGDPSQGHAPPVRTLRANFEEMKSGIPRRMMSKNFIDAVITIRQLGLRYIWIDSLCIVQDWPEDWQKEAATMYKVYKFADITLVATSAITANDGFLERHLSTIPAVKIGYSLDTGKETAESMILCDQGPSETGNWSSDVDGVSWNKRGWTLQERSVSARMLHFCRTKLYFECRGCLKSEENEFLERYTPRTFEMWPRGDDEESKYARLRNPETESQRSHDLYRRWIRAVTEYSQRRLTKETDKLLAIQVLAAEMATSVDDLYLPFAGMWAKQLPQDLLWQVREGAVSMPNKYRAPTWSWASLDGGIHWEAGAVPATHSNRPLSNNNFLILDIANPTNISGPSTTPHNFLKVKAFLKPIAFILECDNDDRWINATRFKFPYDVFYTNATPAHNETVESSVSALSLVERKLAVEAGNFVRFADARLDLDDKDDLTKSQRQLCYLHVSRACPSGLILEAMSKSPTTWRRVGVATVYKYKTGDLFVDSLFMESEPQIEVIIV